MNISGTRWRTPFAMLAAVLVLVAGGSASPASASHTDNRVVDPNRCAGVSQYDNPVFIRGTFAVKRAWDTSLNKAEKRRFNGCYRFDGAGNVLTSEGPRWIVGGSVPFGRGYNHGSDAQRGDDDWVRMGFVGDGQFDNYALVNSYGAIWRNGEWQYVGIWSDWYNAGYRTGYLAEKKRQDIRRETEACQNRVQLVNIQPRTYGPELTFQVRSHWSGEPLEKVIIGFREISAGNREPQIASGVFPWCISVNFSYTASGPKLEIDRGSHVIRFSYDKEGPYFERNHPVLPWKFVRTHNEDLWQRIPVNG